MEEKRHMLEHFFATENHQYPPFQQQWHLFRADLNLPIDGLFDKLVFQTYTPVVSMVFGCNMMHGQTKHVRQNVRHFSLEKT